MTGAVGHRQCLHLGKRHEPKSGSYEANSLDWLWTHFQDCSSRSLLPSLLQDLADPPSMRPAVAQLASPLTTAPVFGSINPGNSSRVSRNLCKMWQNRRFSFLSTNEPFNACRTLGSNSSIAAAASGSVCVGSKPAKIRSSFKL